MAEQGGLDALPAEQELAVGALVTAAVHLPITAVRVLVRRLSEFVLVEAERDTGGRTERSERARRFAAAIRQVGSEIGHAPLSTEYLTVYRDRKARGEDDLPSLSAIVKLFGSWGHALFRAGYGDVVLPSRIEQRRSYRPRRVAKYPLDRLITCLRACAHDLRRIPTIRDYRIWEDEAVKRALASGYARDVPHWRTIQTRFGTWEAALKAAGLSAELEDRAAHWDWSGDGDESDLAKTRPFAAERPDSRRHAAAQGIESSAEGALAAPAGARATAEGDDGGGATHPPRAPERGVQQSGRAGRRLRAVPGLSPQPVRRRS